MNLICDIPSIASVSTKAAMPGADENPTTLVQGTPEWLAMRCGKVTASRINDLVARTKTGWSASRGHYMAELLAERLTGQPAGAYESAAMQWGRAHEDQARRAYSFRYDRSVRTIGFVPHPRIALSGSSPDGCVGEDGLLEIKAPNTATHLDVLVSRDVPGKYLPQMLWQMACTGRAWCDFVSYDPRLPEELRLVVIRVKRDEAAIADLEHEVQIFLGELQVRIDDVYAVARAAGRGEARS